MSRSAVAWMLLVFGLTLLAGLPARWLSSAAPWPVDGVSGSVWQGQAVRVGALGPVSWRLRPWSVQVQAGFQAQRWRVEVDGWPWAWQATLVPAGPVGHLALPYRLSGEWQGQVQVRGAGGRCVAATGQVWADELALVAPWSLALGRGEVRVECAQGWTLLAQLALAGQHRMTLEAGVAGATLAGRIEPGAAVYPVLVGGQWLGQGSEALRRTFRW